MNTVRASVPRTLPPFDAAFEDFYREAWPGAVRLAALLTQHTAAAEDLAQEAFARMYPKWQDVEHPPAYLRTTIVNVCHNWRRRAATERTKLPVLFDSGAADVGFDELADAVATLPFRQRAVLVLRYHLGLSESEIADTLGCRTGTVKSLASRALTQLRKDIEP
jgi:RNA polymerase sigma-70 factor (sigma-E family)